MTNSFEYIFSENSFKGCTYQVMKNLQCATGPVRPWCFNCEKYCVYNQLKIALVLENTTQDNYITEALLAGAVPLYLGAPNVRVWLADPDSVILFSDFHSVEEAANYAKHVMKSADLWKKHTAWRTKRFPLPFIHACRRSTQNVFCNLDTVIPYSNI